MINELTGKIVFPRCRSWSCDRCARQRVADKASRIDGLIADAVAAGQTPYLLTLTFARSAAVEDVQRCWNRLRGGLKRKGDLIRYATSLEKNPGRPGFHLHAVLITKSELSRSAVRELAARAGCAPNMDLQRIQGSEADAARVGWYLIKGTAQLARDSGVRRPVNFSRGVPIANPGAGSPSATGAWHPVRIARHSNGGLPGEGGHQ